MAQCPLHFGDWTAHETVKQFLFQLSDFHSFTTEKSALFDDFCEGLNNVYFIDCLREQVKPKKETSEHIKVELEKETFEYIKEIVEELPKRKKWKEFPNLSVLLLSIARNSLKSQDQESTRNALLSIVKKIYDRYKKKSDSCDSDSKCDFCKESQSNEWQNPDVKKSDFCKSRSLVFRAGCQLLPFQDDENAGWDDKDDDWKKEFAEFRRQHSEEISKFRMLYYSTDNITVFIHRIVERWKRMRDDSAAEKFKGLDDEYYDLNPLRFELPVQSRSAVAFKFANDFIQKFENPKADKQTISKDFVKKLAERFRIIQWEILVRDLVAEAGGDRLCFHPISVAHTISGMPDDRGFLTKFINDTREIECRFEPSYGEIPTKERYNEDSLPKDKIILDKNQATEVEKCRKSFKILLPETPNKYYFIHDDLVRSFANLRTSDKSSNESFNTMLIEDGELSFFSLLWLLRYARWMVDKRAKDENSKEWKSKLKNWKSVKKNGELTSRFRLKKKESSSEPFEDNWKDKWSECNMQEFAEECGLIILLKNDQTDPSQWECIPTRRWRSLITWLRRLNDNLRVTDEADKCRLASVDKLRYSDPLLKRFPIKILNYGKKRTLFIKQLREFLASKDLTDMLDTSDKSLSDASASYKDFTGELGDLVKSLDDYSLLEVESSAGLDDKVLLRCCRGFIPIEHLIRAYKPCEFHLLFQALNWEESSGHSKQAPISIGCATIAGQVEAEPMGDSESSEVTITDFDRWVDPYRTLFSTLSTNFSLPVVKKSSEQIGKDSQKKSFAHQTSGLIGTIYSDPQIKKLSFLSQFSLWLAHVHVTQIWGDVPMHPEQRWENETSQKIVEKLVNLGVCGGIKRAAEPPLKGNVADSWELTQYARELYRKIDVPDSKAGERDECIKDILDSLSFCPVPPTPEWTTGVGFAICFYHGMRQAVYHALKTFVKNQKKVDPKKPCLWIEWENKKVLIYNQEAFPSESSASKDRDFFNRFENKAVTETGKKMFKTVGPKPAPNVDGAWYFEIELIK